MRSRRHVILAATMILLFLNLSWIFAPTSTSAVVVNTTLRPISTGAISGFAANGTSDGSCPGLCEYIDETTADGDTSFLLGGNTVDSSGVFGLGNAPTSGQTATSIIIHVVARSGANSGFGYPPVTVSLTINGSTTSAPTIAFNSNVYQDLTASFTGPWTKSQVDGATVTISKGQNALRPGLYVTQVYAAVAYERPLHTQTASRLYANANSTIPGAFKAATNTAVETQKDVPFRLRMGIAPTDMTWESGAWGPHNNLYKLQYAQLTAASCSSQSTGWADVASGSGAIRWYNNGSVADGAAISDLGANDVSVSGTRVPQTYHESNGFTNSGSITTSQVGIWDFSLVSSGQPAGLSFCFRVINNDNTALNSYVSASYPQIMLTGDLGVTIVDGGGAEVTSPVVPFSSTITTTKQCNTTTAVLGVSSQRIRVTNALVTNGWNISIAPANPTSLWTSGASYYDFNDSAGCSDGGDGDAWGGRLTVDSTAATVTPIGGGCSMTGVSKGGGTAFAEGSIDAITLLSATSSSQRFCDWEMTGVAMSQQVPAQTAPGSYSLDMVITVASP